MALVIRDSGRSRVDVHVNHLDPEGVLYLRPKPVYSSRRFRTGSYSRRVFFDLKQPWSILVDRYQLDWAAPLARHEELLFETFKIVSDRCSNYQRFLFVQK